MDYFRDTNIIIILFEGRDNEIKNKVTDILTNDNNSFYASTISILEMAQLYRKKRINNINYESEEFNTGDKFISYILNELPILKILPFEEKHALIASRLSFVKNHNDPNDLAIIAHAIGEKMLLISCDDKFPLYKEQGASIIHNSR
jgi:toxin-antitoxin system, toxin component, PIN family